MQMFHDVFYIFTGWSQHQKKIDQRSLKISWMESRSQCVQFLESIPLMREVKMQERYYSETIRSEEIHKYNLKLVSKLIDQHPEMTLVVSHEVTVDGHVKQIRFLTNVIEVSAKLVASFCTLDSNSRATDILCVHSRGLNVVMIIALALRAIISRTIEDTNRDGSVMWAGSVTKKRKGGRKGRGRSDTVDEAGQIEYNYPKVHGIGIDEFLPPPSKQKDVLESMLLTLKVPEYERKHLRPGPQVGDNSDNITSRTDIGNEAGDSVNPEEEIKADDSMGVFEI